METLLLNPNDNVEVVLDSNDGKFTVGSKIARSRIDKGSDIIKFGIAIGVAIRDISKGSLVDHFDIREPDKPKVILDHDKTAGFTGVPDYLKKFNGYVNEDGKVGTRNYLCISTSVQCVEGVCEHAVKVIEKDILPKYKNVDGVVLLTHNYGCGVAIDVPEAIIPSRTLGNLLLNPNFGNYALIVGLGCEKLRHEMILSSICQKPGLNGFKFDSLYIQSVDKPGFLSIVSAICKKAEVALEMLNKRTRVPQGLSKLTLGMQCGGSDSFSAITANPLLGRISDIVVTEGGSSIISENTECMDAEDYLISRCINTKVASKLKNEFDWYRNYLNKSGADRSANTSPGNKNGGISSITEKALGSIAKSGSSPIIDVLSPGERVTVPGLNYLSGPASDFICGTLELAAGANLHVFTTGRGSPYSIDGFPVIKVGTNTGLYNKWYDIIDFDAGGFLKIGKIDLFTFEFLQMIIDTASGTKTAAERLGIRNSHVLFNPGPVT